MGPRVPFAILPLVVYLSNKVLLYHVKNSCLCWTSRLEEQFKSDRAISSINKVSSLLRFPPLVTNDSYGTCRMNSLALIELHLVYFSAGLEHWINKENLP